MTTPGEHTRAEILSQPDAWADTLSTLKDILGPAQDLFRAGAYDAVVFTGCGSTHYLALAAASLLRELAGIPAWGFPASEVWLRPGAAIPSGRRTLLVAISRSGETTETVRACETFLQSHPQQDLVTLSCYPGRRMTALGALNLVLPAGQERSVAQTRAFSCLYLAAVALSLAWSGRPEWIPQLDSLPPIARRLLTDEAERARRLGADSSLDRFYFLGSGPLHGLACELSLKMKEMSLSHSEPFHFLEFRHGPQSMVTPQTLLVGLVSESTHLAERAVLHEMRSRGARLLTFGEADADVNFASGVHEALRGVLYLPVGQLLAYERALARGQDPDHPHNLSAVVTLESS